MTSRLTAYFSLVFGFLLVVVACGAQIREARASHYRFMADDAFFNPSGAWSYAVSGWAIGNNGLPATAQTVSWCNNLGAYSSEVSTAISDWESALGFSQFSSVSCGSAQLKVVWTTTAGCPSGNWACMVYSWSSYDGTRLSHYIVGGELRLVSSAITWNSTNVTETVRHELGHFMGLNEHYLHTTPISCNSSHPVTIMDFAPASVSGCGDGSTVTSADASSVGTEYGFSTVSSLVGWNCSSYYGSNTMCLNWYDDEMTNSQVYADYWRCNDPSCSSSTYVIGQWNTNGAGLYQANNSTSQSVSAGSYKYWSAARHYSAASGLGPATYTALVQIP